MLQIKKNDVLTLIFIYCTQFQLNCYFSAANIRHFNKFNALANTSKFQICVFLWSYTKGVWKFGSMLCKNGTSGVTFNLQIIWTYKNKLNFRPIELITTYDLVLIAIIQHFVKSSINLCVFFFCFLKYMRNRHRSNRYYQINV